MLDLEKLALFFGLTLKNNLRYLPVSFKKLAFFGCENRILPILSFHYLVFKDLSLIWDLKALPLGIGNYERSVLNYASLFFGRAS